MTNSTAFLDQPDSKIQERQRTAQSFCLGLTGLISAIVLVGWLVPALGSLLPDGWSQMKATALAMMLSVSALALVRFRREVAYFLGGIAVTSVA